MATATSRQQAKHWCFTLNNPVEGEFIDAELVEYLVVGDEVGESGTNHKQGYVCFKKKMLLTGVKKLLARAHWEVMRSTPKKASDYCKKDGKFFEVGQLPETAPEKRKKIGTQHTTLRSLGG